jgi:ABC-2 type transport system ATP-binding protein
MIQIKQLVKKFDKKTAVQIEDFSIRKGEITGIVGKNGAGKTTLLRLVLDLLKPDAGKVFSKGISVYQSEHWKKYTGSYIDNSFLIDFLNPSEYIAFVCKLHNMNQIVFEERLDALHCLSENTFLHQKKYIRDLSSGDKFKVGLISALIIEPEILVLDEPFNYLDPTSQITLKLLLRNLSERNHTAIMVSSHNLHLISDLCSHIALMEEGRIIKTFVNSAESMQEIEKYFIQQMNE